MIITRFAVTPYLYVGEVSDVEVCRLGDMADPKDIFFGKIETGSDSKIVAHLKVSLRALIFRRA